jgi:hypothetical protein
MAKKEQDPMKRAQKFIEQKQAEALLVRFKKPFFIYAYYKTDVKRENILEIKIETWGDLVKIIKSTELAFECTLEMALISIIMQQTQMLDVKVK